MHRYVAWIEGRQGTFDIVVVAPNIVSAYRAAQDRCDEGEFVRGVNPLASA